MPESSVQGFPKEGKRGAHSGFLTPMLLVVSLQPVSAKSACCRLDSLDSRRGSAGLA